MANADTLEDLVSFHHRKDVISDIRFSPGKISLESYLITNLSMTIYHCVNFYLLLFYLRVSVFTRRGSIVRGESPVFRSVAKYLA